MTLKLQEDARAMSAEGAPRPVEVSGWSVDTRTQNAGDVYFALRGPNFDGHSFIAAALEKGAAAVVVERRWAVPMGALRGVQSVADELLVDDTQKALEDL